MPLTCPVCTESIDALPSNDAASEVKCPRCQSTFGRDQACETLVRGNSPLNMPPPAGAEAGGRRSRGPRALAVPGYELIETIAAGGMGVVVLARHIALDRLVALKMPLPHAMETATDRTRFLREATAAAKLRHANICPVYDVGEHDGRPYIAMGYIRGPTLRQWAKANTPTPRRAANVVALLARAVHFAHEHGVVHRDIKPSNVMIDEETNQPTLMDFGLAKESQTAAQNVEVTRTGQIVGTPAYMAPEQAAGHIDRIGPATDVYALGAVLFDLLCDRPPFLGTTGEIIQKVQSEQPPSPRKYVPRLHRDLETICLKALSLEPAQRYASAAALADDLERFGAGETILARRTPIPVRAWLAARKRPVLSAAVVALVLALVAAIVLGQSVRQQWRINALAARFEQALSSSDWSAASLAEMESALTELKPESLQTASRLHDRMFDGLVAAIEKEIAAPRLDAQQAARIEERIALLADREDQAVRAASLRQTLKQRLTAWDTVFEMGPDNWDDNRWKSSAVGGSVQLEVEWPASWREMERLDWSSYISTNDAGTRGYRFMLVPHWIGNVAGLKRGEKYSFATLQKEGGVMLARIDRIGTALRSVPIDMEALPAGSLKLVMRREGSQLSFQVADQPPLVVEDVFPVGGAEQNRARVNAGDTPIKPRVRLSRQVLAPTASPLEKADSLLAEGNVAGALAMYEEQSRQAGATDAGQEGRYKAANCQLLLNRPDAATALLQPLFAEEGQRWPALAGAQLWLQAIRARKLEEADTIRTVLLSRFPLETLGRLASDELRRPLLDAYRSDLAGPNLIKPGAAARAERGLVLLKVLSLLGESEMEIADTEAMVVRCMWVAGWTDRTLDMAEQLAASPTTNARVRTLIVAAETASQIRRSRGDLSGAERVVEGLLSRKGSGNEQLEALRVERAAIACDRGQWDNAQQELTQFLATWGDKDFMRMWTSSAALMLGYVERKLGHEESATKAWNDELTRARSRLSNSQFGYREISGMAVLNLIVSSASAGKLDDQAVGLLMKTWTGVDPRGTAVSDEGGSLFARDFNDSAVAMLRTGTAGDFSAPLRRLFESARGKTFMHDYALRRVPFADTIRIPATLFAHEYFNAECFDGRPPAQVEAVMWPMIDRCWELYSQEKLGKRHLLGAFMALRGAPKLLGWNGFAQAMPREVTGPMAYLLGLRQLRAKRPADAYGYFEIAKPLSTENAPLTALIDQEMARLNPTTQP